MHFSEDDLIEAPPAWLLDEVFDDHQDDLADLEGLVREYARMPVGQGSALRLRACDKRARVDELVERLDLNPPYVKGTE
jgi:hypothetical protein